MLEVLKAALEKLGVEVVLTQNAVIKDASGHVIGMLSKYSVSDEDIQLHTSKTEFTPVSIEQSLAILLYENFFKDSESRKVLYLKSIERFNETEWHTNVVCGVAVE